MKNLAILRSLLFLGSTSYAQPNCISLDSVLKIVTGKHGFSPSLSAGVTKTIGNIYNGNRSYIWSTGDTVPQITADTGNYWVLSLLEKDTLADTFMIALRSFDGTTMVDSICDADSIQVTARGNIALWSNGDSSQVKWLKPVNYWVNTDSMGCTVVDSFFITGIKIDKEILNTDVYTCNEKVSVEAKTNLDIVWDNGTIQKLRTFAQSGFYWIETGISNCRWYDTIQVEFRPKPTLSLSHDEFLCEGDTALIQFSSNTDDIRINGEKVSSPAYITEPGVYQVRAIKGRCETEDYITIGLRSYDRLISDTTICLTATPWLFEDLMARNGDYHLVDSSFFNETFFAESQVQISPKSCVSQESVSIVDIVECDCDRIFIPNTFTPNLDTENQYFSIKTDCEFDDFRLSVYDRWGQLIFLTNDKEVLWDGKCSDEDCAVGTYVYELEYSVLGLSKSRRGLIQLIR